MASEKWELLLKIEDGCGNLLRELNSGLDGTYVGGEGPTEYVPTAMIIGEAPGGQEAMAGRPFVGPSGAVLEQLCSTAGFSRESAWVTNVVKFRPPGNRTPTDDEVTAFKKWLRREWLTIGKPWWVIAVGGVALHAIMGRKLSILKTAGKPIHHVSSLGDRMVIWPMIHPSFGLRNPGVRPILEKHWTDMGTWHERMIR